MINRATNLGESASKKENSDFISISNDAIELVEEEFPSDLDFDSKFEKWLLSNFLNYSLETSQSLISLVSSDFIKQSYMMNRVRLEQTIVSSYLIHSDDKEGILPYFLQTGINLYKTYTMSQLNPDSGKLLEKFLEKFDVDTDTYQELADLAQSEKNKLRDKENDKYDREWTKLDLRSMAIKRDKLIKEKDYLIAKAGLETYYNGNYKSASYLIHGEAIFMASSFHESAKQLNQISVLSNNCAYDLIQIEEIADFFDLEIEEKFQPLTIRYFKALKEHLLGQFI